MTIAKRSGIIAGTAVSAFLIAIIAWFSYPSPGEVSTAIGHEVREKRASAVNLADLTKFSWDEMLSFGSYQRREKICPALGLFGFRCWWVVPSMVDENYYFVVFRNKSSIVHYEHHRRLNGDFYHSGQPQPLPNNDAAFLVTQSDTTAAGEPWFSLKYKSLNSNLPLNSDVRKSSARRSATR